MLEYMIAFIVSFLAGVACYYFCKWLEDDGSDNQPKKKRPGLLTRPFFRATL